MLIMFLLVIELFQVDMRYASSSHVTGYRDYLISERAEFWYWRGKKLTRQDWGHLRARTFGRRISGKGCHLSLPKKTPTFERPANLPAPSQTGQISLSAFVSVKSIRDGNRAELTSFSWSSGVGDCELIGYYNGPSSLVVSQLTTDEGGSLGRTETQHQIWCG